MPCSSSFTVCVVRAHAARADPHPQRLRACTINALAQGQDAHQERRTAACVSERDSSRVTSRDRLADDDTPCFLAAPNRRRLLTKLTTSEWREPSPPAARARSPPVTSDLLVTRAAAAAARCRRTACSRAAAAATTVRPRLRAVPQGLTALNASAPAPACGKRQRLRRVGANVLSTRARIACALNPPGRGPTSYLFATWPWRRARSLNNSKHRPMRRRPRARSAIARASGRLRRCRCPVPCAAVLIHHHTSHPTRLVQGARRTQDVGSRGVQGYSTRGCFAVCWVGFTISY